MCIHNYLQIPTYVIGCMHVCVVNIIYIGSGRSTGTMVGRPGQLVFRSRFWSRDRHDTRGGTSPSDSHCRGAAIFGWRVRGCSCRPALEADDRPRDEVWSTRRYVAASRRLEQLDGSARGAKDSGGTAGWKGSWVAVTGCFVRGAYFIVISAVTKAPPLTLQRWPTAVETRLPLIYLHGRPILRGARNGTGKRLRSCRYGWR